MASASLNGANTWQCPSDSGSKSSVSLMLSIPPNRNSTFIVISGSDPPSTTRTNYLAFTGNSLTLLAGLAFVDDLDGINGSVWTQ